MCENPIEALEQQKLTARNKNKRATKLLPTETSRESSVSDGEVAKEQVILKKRNKHGHRRKKRARTDDAAKIPAPMSGSENEVDRDSDDEIAPGANEDPEEFAHGDACAAEAIKLSQKAQRLQDLETVFTEVIQDGQESYRVCQVCQ
ncbi:uncharacterized protein EI90DRAFT_3010867 [Cantharellus anzutake]|uniref:uncharacterized protein n=1 Tax=Cantharellus anzutake TaxID=1750568 RepID=UPI0019036228|nr:uncharacterized protein EI90DRAFT_3010867 [Cantharellus anzutake]KAF8344049.1 hypothetical protein EI90DRAFT_3010867 [Cantharellus anzutake]